LTVKPNHPLMGQVRDLRELHGPDIDGLGPRRTRYAPGCNSSGDRQIQSPRRETGCGLFVEVTCPATSATTTGYVKPIPTSPLTSTAIVQTPVIAEGRRCRAGRVVGIFQRVAMIRLADDYASIRRRMEAIESEKMQSPTGEARSFTVIPTGVVSSSLTLAVADLPPYTPSTLNEAARLYMAECSFNLPDFRGRANSGDLVGAPDIEVTPAMVDAGVAVLWGSGAVDNPCSIDRDLVCEIYKRMAATASR